MTKQMPKNFDFAEAEARIYAWWQDNGWFKPESAPADAEPFVISMPPPNVTGALHIGHALFSTLEDLMIRYERMRGKAALWVPGTDHAGIATQLQVEKLLRDEGTSRQAIGRDAFVKRVWEWKDLYGGTIIRQLRRLGASCDWDRERFTMDEGLSNAVQDVFIRLYEQGLIYRGPRLVNWSPGLQTAVSDLEVEREEEDGKLYLFHYPVEGGGSLPVATTRPETILGDTAVAVHPEDPRYAEFIGRKALVPMLNRAIPIIADEYVDREFGTGALKVTPGHDFNDYELAQRHNLAIINIMNKDATINTNGGDYAGMDRFACREKLWADMAAAGMTIEVRPHRMVVPRSQRGGEVIEPMLSTQWYVKIQPLAEKAIAAVRDGRIMIVPERFEKIYFNWLENIQDWCISRQLWWGHRIPVWYREDGSMFVGRSAPEGDGWTEGEDVLDTWFSSGLWPFSTLGWPEQTADLGRFYPTHVMETGYDILFFWVARMIMLGLWFTDEAPFKTVYLHGLVRDKFGRKISKTLGNVIDPLILIDKYGADPLRLALVTGSTPGNDINLDEARVERNWRFVNKIWQMTNFVTAALGDAPLTAVPARAQLDLPSRWIMSRLNRLVQSVQRTFDAHQYGEAGRQIDDFIWGEFADWYIEMSKQPLYQGSDEEKSAARAVLVHVLETSLRLMHPYMPFVTEEAWSYLPGENKTPLIRSQWPTADESYFDDEAERQMTTLIELIRGVRNTREEYKVEPSRKISVIATAGDDSRALLGRYGYLFARLCNVGDLSVDAAAPEQAASVIFGDITLSLPLADFVDAAAECERLGKELEKTEEAARRTETMLSNEQFISRARPDVVERERQKLADLTASSEQLRARIASLCG
ncbi:MAG: valine--tRNA ligase [Pleurocapsa minor GSE-CHR-MK-17-07R]|jgi:valyl-tRNA synthetase|nr:valine--tRNA ligase [Pleurocapsa minor GSE-CHR-MK 17-07R]